VNVLWDGQSGGQATAGNYSVRLDMPKKFGGQGRNLCPDELFLSSIGGCLLTTFLYLKKRFKLQVSDYKVEVKGDLELIEREGYRIVGVKAKIKVKVVEGEDKTKVKNVLLLSKDYCHITRSIEKSIPVKVITKVL
jgi:uncharacterized OsmC-like protein